jgi:hypothetical protein
LHQSKSNAMTSALAKAVKNIKSVVGGSSVKALLRLSTSLLPNQ